MYQIYRSDCNVSVLKLIADWGMLYGAAVSCICSWNLIGRLIVKRLSINSRLGFCLYWFWATSRVACAKSTTWRWMNLKSLWTGNTQISKRVPSVPENYFAQRSNKLLMNRRTEPCIMYVASLGDIRLVSVVVITAGSDDHVVSSRPRFEPGTDLVELFWCFTPFIFNFFLRVVYSIYTWHAVTRIVSL